MGSAGKKVRVGVVGYGNSAKNFQIPFIQAVPDLEITAILQRREAPSSSSSDAQSSPSSSSHCTVDLPHVRHHQTAEDFFADDGVDLVVVATHTDTHASFAESALLAGKHVIIDKPFARTSAEADRVIKLADEKGLIVTCYQNRRWDGDFQTLLDLKARNAFGKIMEAEIHYDFESPHWMKHMTAKNYTPGAGMAFGLGTHSIDQAIVLFGQPECVTGFFRAQRGIESEVEDSFTIILQFGGDQDLLLVTVKTSVTTPMQKQLKYLIRGTEGSFVKWQQRSTCCQEEQISLGMKPSDDGFGSEPEAMYGTLTSCEEFDSRYQKLDPATGKYVGKIPTATGRWAGLYQNVADAILGRAELAVKATQSRDVIRVIELARESHKRRTTVPWT